MIAKCPYCKREQDFILEYHKQGRFSVCEKCKNKVIFRKGVSGYKRDEHGSLKRK